MNKKIPFLAILAILTFSISCDTQTNSDQQEESVIEDPKEWSKNATIYEVNIRQYTPEGTINAFVEHLPQLYSMGVDILWLMPIFPIGEENRKGGMGSAYSVKDYRAVNPDFGTLEDMQKLVTKAHDLGMYVILDWVANHTAWDNQLINEHPEWYSKDSLGNIVSPNSDWVDVADLNFDNPEMRTYMINSLKFWVTETGVDGFRYDVAWAVPVDFWDQVRVSLDSVKPLFMLGESEDPVHMLKAFDMHFGWEIHHTTNSIAQGKTDLSHLDDSFRKYDSLYQKDDIRMNFTSNHDENTWQGTVNERMGDAAEMMTVFTYMIPGMPLIYSGQEAGLDKRLAFFEKDSIDWKDSEWRTLYTNLNNLKKENKALWNGIYGGDLIKFETDSEFIFAFEREKEGDKIMAIFNMSDQSQQAFITSNIELNTFKNYFTGVEVKIEKGFELSLEPWEYIVLTNK